MPPSGPVGSTLTHAVYQCSDERRAPDDRRPPGGGGGATQGAAGAHCHSQGRSGGTQGRRVAQQDGGPATGGAEA